MKNSKLLNEAFRITAGAPAPVFRVDVYLALPTGLMPFYEFLGQQINNSYIDNSFASTITISVLSEVESYMKYVFPIKQNLEIVLIHRQCLRDTGNVIPGGITFKRSYRGVLIDANEASFGAGGATPPPVGGLKDSLMTLNIQLIEFCVADIMLRQGGGEFRITTAMSALQATLGLFVNPPNTEDRNRITFSYVPSDVTDVRNSVMIPQSTKLVEMPYYVHEQCGGLYQHGIGSFIQNKVWHIYPKYNLQINRNYTKRKLTIVHVPTQQFGISEKTWISLGNDVRIVCQGAAKITELSTAMQLQMGNGARLIKGDDLLLNSTEESGNKAVNKPGNATIGFATEERLDGKNLAQLLPVGETPATVMSKLAAGRLQLMTLQWKESDAQLITPCMPVTVLYDNTGQVVVYEGVVIAVDELTERYESGIINKATHANAVITLLITRSPTKTI